MPSRRLEMSQKVIRDQAIFIQLDDAIFSISKAYYCYEARWCRERKDYQVLIRWNDSNCSSDFGFSYLYLRNA